MTGRLPEVVLVEDDPGEARLIRRAVARSGLAHEYAGRVFGIFQPLVGRSQAAGTGIGLGLVRTAVENHRGTIWTDSEPGVGTIFPFILPRPLTAESSRFPS